MQRSLFERYASRPGIAFPVPMSRLRAPRLGLNRQSWFLPAARTATVLRRVEQGPVALLRPEWRGVATAHAGGAAGHGGPLAIVRWAKPDGRAAGRRARAASAPWRG